VTDTLELVEADCRARGRLDLWEVLRLRAVDPILNGAEPTPYEQIVDQLQLGTPRQAINLLVTAKRSFLRHLHTAVGRYVDGAERIEEEIKDLREIVNR
jgi:hypothetical protein